jgi:hypothetical protein
MIECPECGAVASDDDLYCGECGAALAAASATAPSTPTPLTPATAQGLPPVSASPPAASQRRSGLVAPLIVGLVGLGLFCLVGIGLLVVLVVNGNRTAEPTAGSPQPGQIVLTDTFGNPDSGWDTYTDDDTWAGYVDGEYRLGVYRSNFVTWGNPSSGQKLSNFEIEVDARQVEGPIDNDFGVLVRYQSDDNNFYWFQISSDGYYSVDLLEDGEWVSLVPWTESSTINQGVGATNHIKVVCYNELFSLYVNDVYLTGVTDTTFQSGNVGLAAGTFDESGVVVDFDNVQVRLLED